jgi:hypothetical protein
VTFVTRQRNRGHSEVLDSPQKFNVPITFPPSNLFLFWAKRSHPKTCIANWDPSPSKTMTCDSQPDPQKTVLLKIEFSSCVVLVVVNGSALIRNVSGTGLERAWNGTNSLRESIASSSQIRHRRPPQSQLLLVSSDPSPAMDEALRMTVRQLFKTTSLRDLVLPSVIALAQHINRSGIREFMTSKKKTIRPLLSGAELWLPEFVHNRRRSVCIRIR